ncbi:YceI family protein [Stenotrophomonas rhizophila]
MRPSLLLALLVISSAPAVATAAPVTYQLDPTHTDVLFTWNHNGFSFPTGRAAISSGTLIYDAAKPAASQVQVELPLAELDTHVPKLDEIVKGDKLFDVAKHPQASFRSTSVVSQGTGRLKITGDLTLHGVTRPVVLDATLNKVGEHPSRKVPTIGFNATAVIRRSEFGVTGFLPNIADEVQLRITTEGQGAKE